MLVISGTDRRGARNRLTPDEVQAVDFPSSRLGRRGFDEEHVRAFCGQVERELVLLRNERNMLTDEVQRLRRRVLGQDGDEAGSGRPEDAHVHAARILSTAQQTADRCVATPRSTAGSCPTTPCAAGTRSWPRPGRRRCRCSSKAHGAASRAAEAALATPENPPGPEPPGTRGRAGLPAQVQRRLPRAPARLPRDAVSDEGEPEPAGRPRGPRPRAAVPSAPPAAAADRIAWIRARGRLGLRPVCAARPHGVRGNRARTRPATGHARGRQQHVFETLSDRLTQVFSSLRGQGRLSAADIDATAREIRIALLEADVALPVVRQFIARGEGAGVRHRGVRRAEPRPAGHQDRQRRAHRDPRGRGQAAAVRQDAAHRDHAGRPSGIR